MPLALFVMMAGIPGSGKSTAAARLALEHGAVLVSTDALRRELTGREEDRSLDGMVFARAMDRIGEELSRGRNVVYDATNLTPAGRRRVLRALPPGTRRVCFFLRIPLAAALLRNQARSRVVPAPVIARMYDKMKEPTPEEGWDEIHIMG